MSEFESHFLTWFGSLFTGFWNALAKVSVFGMTGQMIFVSAIAISIILPFFLQFLSSGVGFITSKENAAVVQFHRERDEVRRRNYKKSK